MALTLPDSVLMENRACDVACDSVAGDSTVAPVRWGLLLDAPATHNPAEAVWKPDYGSSWAVAALVLLVAVVAVRLQRAPRFLATLVSDMGSVRERHNMFDTTVRESTLLVLLNLLTVLSAGVIMGGAGLVRMGLCAGLAALYMMVMWLAYTLVGRVFTDASQTRVWVRGFVSSMGLLSFLAVPCALFCIGQPEWAGVLTYVAACGFIAAKMVFIVKGFRIFFTEAASWVLFLYYLCSLEAVPVILLLRAAVAL